jgi:hypothetical protein
MSRIKGEALYVRKLHCAKNQVVDNDSEECYVVFTAARGVDD